MSQMLWATRPKHTLTMNAFTGRAHLQDNGIHSVHPFQRTGLRFDTGYAGRHQRNGHRRHPSNRDRSCTESPKFERPSWSGSAHEFRRPRRASHRYHGGIGYVSIRRAFWAKDCRQKVLLAEAPSVCIGLFRRRPNVDEFGKAVTEIMGTFDAFCQVTLNMK